MASSTAISSSLEGYDVIANLSVISYEKLMRKDRAEAAKLLSACTEDGFFYLDLSDRETRPYLENVENLFKFSKDYFNRSFEKKLEDTNRDDISVFNICGYKPSGLDTGNMEHKKDGCEGMRESASIPIDLVFNPGMNPRLYRPKGVCEQWNLFTEFISESHTMTNTILQSLSNSFGLKLQERFEAHHKPNSLSTSAAVLQYYPLTDLPPDTSVGHFTHTDTGSITILFNTDWGLQVYSSERDSWEYVTPRPNFAIVNIGDALKFMSGQRLKSSLHRVVPWHGRWTSGPRYASIFFLRPNNDTEFVDSEGVKWTAGDWLNRKFGNYRTPHSEQRKNALSTGRKDFVGLWETPSSAVPT